MRVCENGVYRDMTESEVDAIKLANQKELLDNATAYNLTAEDIIMILAKNITITLPDGETDTADNLIGTQIELPLKLGQKWVLNGTTFALVDDPDAVGTSEDNAIIWYDGCPEINNAWYKKNGELCVYMNGEFITWNTEGGDA